MFFSFVKEETRWLLYAEKLLGPWVFVVFRREFLHPMHKFYNFLRAKGLPWLLWAKLTLASLFPAVTRSCHYYFWPPSSAARVFAPCQSMREMRFIVFVKKIYYALCMNPKPAQQIPFSNPCVLWLYLKSLQKLYHLSKVGKDSQITKGL